MYSSQDKLWMSAIAEREIRNYAEFALYEAGADRDQNKDELAHPFYSTFTDLVGGRYDFYFSLNITTFLARFQAFQGLVYQLAKHDMIDVAPDGMEHIIDIRPQWLKGVNKDEAIVNFQQELWSRLTCQSNYLSDERRRTLLHESFLALPKLSSYIANGFRTQDQIEHDDLKKQARDARDDAARANRTSVFLAWITIIASLISAGLQFVSVTSTTKVDINSLPQEHRTVPNLPKLQPN